MFATEADARYYQGLMDGIVFALPDNPNAREALRKELAEMKHVCYSSLFGPYCVICRKDIDPPFDPRWSK